MTYTGPPSVRLPLTEAYDTEAYDAEAVQYMLLVIRVVLLLILSLTSAPESIQLLKDHIKKFLLL